MRYTVPERTFITSKETAMQIVKEIMPVAKEITELVLRNCAVEKEGLKAIADAIGKPKNLFYLDLTGIFGGRSPEAIKELLSFLCEWLKDTQIREFNISNNAVSSTCAHQLAKIIKEMPKIKVLNLCNLGLGKDGMQRINEALESLVRRGASLVSLDMSRNRGEKGAVSLTKTVCRFKALRSLSIGKNGLTAEETTPILETLWRSARDGKTMMENLEIDDSTISKEGAQYLGKILTKMSVAKLDLANCIIKDAGFSEIAAEVKKMYKPEEFQGSFVLTPQLDTLVLTNNWLTKNILPVLEEVIDILEVKKIHMEENLEDDESALLDALEKRRGVVVVKDGEDTGQQDAPSKKVQDIASMISNM